jgi:hypothetical protein
MTQAALDSLQRRFQQHLLDPASDALSDLVTESPSVSRATRLFIYSNAYRSRLVEAASVDFAGLHGYLGDDAFGQLILAYLDAHPSTHPSLRWFGQHLPAFLSKTAPYAAHRDLAELADFEWALCHAFDAADSPVMALADLRALDPAAWPQMKLGFHASANVIELFGNAPALWQALNDSASPPSYVCEPTTSSWLIWRSTLRLLFRQQSEAEAQVFRLFQHGGSFSEACVELEHWHAAEVVPIQAAKLLQQWLAEGLVARIET